MRNQDELFNAQKQSNFWQLLVSIKRTNTFIIITMFLLISFLMGANQLQIVLTSSESNQTSTKKRAALYPTGSLDLPEIIINKAVTSKSYFNGYHYPLPNPPFQFDEPVLPSYLPPIQSTPPVNDPSYLPPLNDLAPPYYDPTEPPNQNEYLPPIIAKSATNMSCLDTNANKFFRATVKLNSNALNPPVIDGASAEDCVRSLSGGEFFQLDLAGNQIMACGVRYCSDRNMCVRVRIPMVNGLRMLEDQQILLQCRLQEPVLVGTKKFRIGPVRMLQGRALGSSTSVTAGGSRRNFDMDVTLYRRNGAAGNPEQPPGTVVSAGSTVYLGDELLLRAAVREGDGWRYSRISTVTIHAASPNTNVDTTNSNPVQSVTLLDERGCRVEVMRAVCPEQPRQIGPMTVSVPFRAFLFQQTQSPLVGGGLNVPHQEEMVLSVRMVACLEAHDCAVPACNMISRGRIRAKRSSDNKRKLDENNGASTDIETYLDFRVIANRSPEENYAKEVKRIETASKLMNPTIIISISGVIILATFGALVYLKNKKNGSKFYR